jgi:hypothetical protein
MLRISIWTPARNFQTNRLCGISTIEYLHDFGCVILKNLGKQWV